MYEKYKIICYLSPRFPIIFRHIFLTNVEYMSRKIRQIILLFLWLTAIPTLGLAASNSLINAHSNAFQTSLAKQYGVPLETVRAKGITVESLCAKIKTVTISGVCRDLSDFQILRTVNEDSIFGGTALVGFVLISAFAARNSRRLLAASFGPVTAIVMLALSVSILLQGGTIVYLSYAMPSFFRGYLAGDYIPQLTLIAGIGALGVSGMMFANTLLLFKRHPMLVAGSAVDRQEAPGLHRLVDEIAEKLSAPLPQNVVVGLEPNIYATAGDIQLLGTGQPLSGTTLYLALPFLSILRKEELSAILGHELDHFIGADLAYSVRFAPAHSRMRGVLGSIRAHIRSADETGFLELPALTALTVVNSAYSAAWHRLSRRHERVADRKAASLANKYALVTALMKMVEYRQIWNALRLSSVEHLNRGDLHEELAEMYSRVGELRYRELNFDEAKRSLIETKLAHPTDRHPTIMERMKELAVSPDEITKEDLRPAHEPLSNYFADETAISHELSMKEHHLLVMMALGHAQLPETEEAAEMQKNRQDTQADAPSA